MQARYGFRQSLEMSFLRDFPADVKGIVDWHTIACYSLVVLSVSARTLPNQALQIEP